MLRWQFFNFSTMLRWHDRAEAANPCPVPLCTEDVHTPYTSSSHLHWLQLHAQTVVFWQEVSVPGLCLLQLSLQLSFILSAPLLEFTQFLLCILSTSEKFQQQNSSSWTMKKHPLYTQKNNTALQHRRLYALLQNMYSTGREIHANVFCHAWEVTP